MVVNEQLTSHATGRRHSGWVLPSQTLRQLLETGVVTADSPVSEQQIQPASLDLRLGSKAFQLRASFLPGHQSTVKDGIAELLVQEMDISSGAVFLPGQVYLVPLIERVELPERYCGKANPRSTTGRLDILTRLVVDGAAEFDFVPNGYQGQLYGEIVPRTFAVRARRGLSLNQVRFFDGTDQRRSHTDTELSSLQPLALDSDGLRPAGRVRGGLRVSVDLHGADDHPIGYKARKSAPVLDLTKFNEYAVTDYWDVITRQPGNGLILQPDDFYLLVSCERVRVPSTHAAEMVAYDTAMGEIRVHYAGFFDPGFGYFPGKEEQGTRAVLEVRSHEFPFRLEHGQEVGRLLYESMKEEPDKLYGGTIGSSYQGQSLKLSKHFVQ